MNSLTSAVGAVITDEAGRVRVCQPRHGLRWWGLPGGPIRPDEGPIHAACRDIFSEIGAEAELVDLVGLYQLTGGGDDMPDMLMHVFRGRLHRGEVAVNTPRIGRLAWYDQDALPGPLTACTRIALADAAQARSGVLRTVQRDAEPELPDADADDVSPAVAAAILA
jgi:ADP-ribose pyrophosphatase YjhB (NUDIX family)